MRRDGIFCLNMDRRGHRPQVAVWLLVLAGVMIAPLSGCGRGNPKQAHVTPTPSMTTTQTTAATPAPTRATTATATAVEQQADRLRGPQAQDADWALRTGRVEKWPDEDETRAWILIWVEVENRSDRSLTVSSLLSVAWKDSQSGAEGEAGDVVRMLSRIAEMEPDGRTLDGNVLPGDRLTGWVYARLPADTQQVILTITPVETAQAVPFASLAVEVTCPDE